MPQLLVRDIETAVVVRLRKRAAELGVSVEEAHRRLLREALLGDLPGAGRNFSEFLLSIPKDDGPDFTRAKDMPRDISF